MNLYGGGIVVRALKHFGVKHLFSLPGHQTLSIFDACKAEGLDLVSTRHEASAVFMAQAMAFTERGPGAVVLAGGPELTNALTAIAQASYACTPLVVISGSNSAPKRDRGFPQDMDQLQLVRPFTKWARSCHAVDRIPEYIEAAFRHAMQGRPGPAYLEIPYDVMESRIQAASAIYPDRPVPLRPGPDPRMLAQLAAMLGRARRPIAIAGSGAFWSGADEELLRFVQNRRIPLFLNNSALTMPFPQEEYFGLGSPGWGRPALWAIADADLILLLGTRMNFTLGFGMQPFISARQKIVQIDIEAESMGANRAVDLAITADLRTALEVVNSLDLPQPEKAVEKWRAQLKAECERFEKTLASLGQGPRRSIHPMQLVREIEAARTDNSTLVLDGANSILWALLAAKPRPEGGIVISSMGELQAIGAGVPQALALKRARPDQQVILHTGDGSLGYGLMEMETAARYDIPIVIVVHNDSAWGMTRDMQAEFFGKGGGQGNQLGVVRYEQMIQALGGYGEFVERAEDIGPAIRRALDSGKPACVNVMVDPAPKSPALKTFMLMEVMLGKQTYYDRVPSWMRRLQTTGLDRAARRAMLRYLDHMLHADM
jgi:thiamine pyrophosphate-dependent acetolactate synthase large subunit-like protein